MLSFFFRAAVVVLLGLELQGLLAHVSHDATDNELLIWKFANGSQIVFNLMAIIAFIFSESKELRLLNNSFFTSVVFPYSMALVFLTVRGRPIAAQSLTSFVAPLITLIEILLHQHAPARPNVPVLLSVLSAGATAYSHPKAQYFYFIFTLLVGTLAWIVLRILEDLLWHNISTPPTTPSSTPTPASDAGESSSSTIEPIKPAPVNPVFPQATDHVVAQPSPKASPAVKANANPVVPAGEHTEAQPATPKDRRASNRFEREMKRLAPFGTPGPNSPGFGDLPGDRSRYSRRVRADAN